MSKDIFIYLDQLQMLAFFSGYVFVYLLVSFLLDVKNPKLAAIGKSIVALLPLGYALTGTLFLGLIAKNIYMDGTAMALNNQLLNPYLKIFGLLSLLFWLPMFARKRKYSLLHSLCFLFFIIKDLFLFSISKMNKETIQNDLRVFTDSVILNILSFTAIMVSYFAIKRFRDR